MHSAFQILRPPGSHGPSSVFATKSVNHPGWPGMRGMGLTGGRDLVIIFRLMRDFIRRPYGLLALVLMMAGAVWGQGVAGPVVEVILVDGVMSEAWPDDGVVAFRRETRHCAANPKCFRATSLKTTPSIPRSSGSSSIRTIFPVSAATPPSLTLPRSRLRFRRPPQAVTKNGCQADVSDCSSHATFAAPPDPAGRCSSHATVAAPPDPVRRHQERMPVG